MPSSREEGKSFGMELKQELRRAFLSPLSLLLYSSWVMDHPTTHARTSMHPQPHIYGARVDMICILLFHQNYDLAYQDFFSIGLS